MAKGYPMNEPKPLILITDDEPQIRKMLRITLEAAGYRTQEAESGKESLKLANALKPDLMLLDLGLPDIDGTEVIKQVREWSTLPILVVSVRSDDKDMVKAFDAGADDYVTKPFSTEVLIARIRAAVRRSLQKDSGDTELHVGDIHVDLLKYEVKVRGKVVPLSPKEYNLLAFFLRNTGKMLTHRQILKEVWGPAHTHDTQYLRVYIGQLRKKIEADPENPQYIVTEAGIGYRLDAPLPTS
jgi:two-component system KDP operon response regulator KdpE